MLFEGSLLYLAPDKGNQDNLDRSYDSLKDL